MNWHWKDLLPIDRYTVRTSGLLNDTDQKVLTLLYQPLIGSLAHSLYLTLWSQLEKDVYWSDEYTHRHLMTLMDMPLNIVYEARKKLEGIGLMNVFKKKDDEGSLYLYELQSPMSPDLFFADDVLSVYLYNRLGTKIYRQTRERFTIEKISNEEYYEVTRSFDEVYTSLHHSEMVMNHHSEQAEGLGLESSQEIIRNKNSHSLTMINQHFDYELFLSGLANFISHDKLLSHEVKETIVRLAFVYRIDAIEMSRIVQQTVLHDDDIDILELRKRVREWYKIEHGNEPPTLALRRHPEQYQTMLNKEPLNEKEQMVKFFESVSPIELLESRSGGGKVPPPDVKIIEDLLLDYHLLPGVVNVLLDYVLQKNDMKLSKPLIDKIAGHWKRKNIKTVADAMALAKEENRKNLEFQGKKNFQPIKGKLPKWLTEDKGS